MSKTLVLGAAALMFLAAEASAADLMTPDYGYAVPTYGAPAPVYAAPGYGYASMEHRPRQERPLLS